jgi:hypothetical protein
MVLVPPPSPEQERVSDKARAKAARRAGLARYVLIASSPKVTTK